MARRNRYSRGFILLPVAVALLGGVGMALSWMPRLQPSPLPAVPESPLELAAWIDAHERGLPLREDTAARIVWANPERPQRTACSIVYLHGFTASQGEAAPLHRQIARTFGCNLFLPRWPGHGLRHDDALRGVTAQQLLDAAAEAVAVGRQLGERTILIGTSMGGALATQMTAQHGDQIAATVLWSPLVNARNLTMQKLLWRPWGPAVIRHRFNNGEELVRGAAIDSPYWAGAGHLDGYAAAARLALGMNPDTFARVRVPLFLGYWYRDEQRQDPTVSVAAMQWMLPQLGTPEPLRWVRNFPEAGDHVIASPLRSRAAGEVFASTCQFLRQAVQLQPVRNHPRPCAAQPASIDEYSAR